MPGPLGSPLTAVVAASDSSDSIGDSSDSIGDSSDRSDRGDRGDSIQYSDNIVRVSPMSP